MEKELNESETEDSGGFLLDSLATLNTVEIQSVEGATSGDTPRAIIRPKVVQVNTAKAIRELRESQRKLEKRIAVLTSTIVISMIVAVVLFQTEILEGGIDGMREKLGLVQEANINTNCSIPENKSLEICIERASKTKSSWQVIERSGGAGVNHFSLNGM